MRKYARKIARKIFTVFGINRSLAFQFLYGDAFKAQKKLMDTISPVVFDVGAFDGRSAATYKKYFPGAVIHSFEPFPKSFKKLAAGKIDTTHLLNEFALSDSEANASFYVNFYKATNSLLPSSEYGLEVSKAQSAETIITVHQRKLDNYCSEKGIKAIDILKIDVQGAELKVLKGAERMLSQKLIGLIYLEVEFKQLYQNQPLFDDISIYLRSKGYQFFSFYNYSCLRNGRLLAADALFVSSEV